MASKETLHSVFVTALEGGIGYWSTCSKYVWSKDGKGEEEDLAGFHAIVCDTEDEDAVPFRIDAELIQRGITQFIAKDFNPRHSGYVRIQRLCLALQRGGSAAEDALCEMDAGDADCIVQMGHFNEVVYG
jgi:hypothetical protein